MRCPRCEHDNPAGMKFCGQCAAPLAAACPACGAGNPSGNRFCGQCAAPLSPDSRAKVARPDSYTPQHLAEKILTSRAALEGERKQVTVLFADVKGSMEMLGDRDPEEARKLLDPVLERMMEAVHRYEGTVNQVMGDGIMALFGAPLAHEDHAVRACFAALRMQESLKRHAEDARRAHGVEILVRVGLNSGEVVVRAIGSDLRMDYSAVGQTTNLAARMEQMAPPGTVRLTAGTAGLAEGYVEVRSLGPIPVKGLPDPIEIFELTGPGTARTRLQAAVLRGLTRFVGRDAEAEHLRRILGQAGAGRGQVVAIVGEAGVGKSRLTYEFTHSHRAQDWLILHVSSVSYGKATSYLPVIDLLRGYFKIGDRDDRREMRTKVLGRVLGLDRALEPHLPPLLALLDVPVEDPAWQKLDPPQRRQAMLDAVNRLLLRESHAQPLLVIFEDLHWVDAETQALLDSVVESLGSARLLLLVTYRPEYEHRWGSKTAYSQLRLDSLPVESAAELLAALLGPDPGLTPLRQMLVKRGNPFFLEETVRTLVETGALAGERGAYRLTRPVEALQVPATVHAILAARIDRLPVEEKQLLQAASVIGQDVPYALLAAIAEQPEEALRRGLGHLQETEFLYETQLFPDLEYSFKHALTHDVAYGSMLQDRRRFLHARIVDAIEAVYPGRLTEQVERLGHHAFRGDLWAKSVTYLRQAGAKAFARSANREAVACLDQALTALTHLPESRETLQQAIDLRLDLRNSLIPLGELGRIVDCLREAETLATTVGDQHRLGWVSTFMTNCLWHLGNHEQAVDVGRRALGIATALEDVSLRAEASFRLGQAYHPLGDYRRAIPFLRESVDCLHGELSYERFGGSGVLSVFSRTWLAWCLAELGEFEEGIVRGEEAVQIAQAVDHPYTLTHAHFGVSLVYLRKGYIDKAISVLERSLVLCRAADLHGPFPVVAGQLGVAYAVAGRITESLPLLAQVAERAASMKLRWGNAPWLAWLGEAYLLGGELDEARRVASRTLAISREHKERGQQAWVLRLLAEIASHRDPPQADEAGDRYREALERAQELGMRPLVAHCHLGRGKLSRRMGRRAQAQQHLMSAAKMYREMDMRFWLEQAEAEIRDGN